MSVQRSEHDNKYDRQMRLWGGHGQQELENARVLCFGSGPTASETLKNLVLPNVGHFTIVDDAITSRSDLGNNFFVEEEGVGKPRAQVVTELLLEMNPGVEGKHVQRSAEDVLEKDPDFIKGYTVVVATCLVQETLSKLGDVCLRANIPLVAVRSYGLFGHIRLQVEEHLVTESHPDNDRFDLFCHPDQLKRFPDLQAFVDELNYEKMDDYHHSHVPYVVILAREAQKWLKKHGAMPSTYQDQKEYKEQIKSASRDISTEQNFEEAVKFAYRSYDQPKLDWLSAAVLTDAKASEITKESKPFWVLVAALKAFLEKEGHGMLPASNNIPDMISETGHYVRLKEIYAAKANADFEIIWAHTQAILEKAGQSADAITRYQAEHFVKHCRGIRCIRTRSLAQEFNNDSFNTEEVMEILDDYVEVDPEAEQEVPRHVYWYFALRAVDMFRAKHGRYPGVGGDQEQDAVELEALQTTFLTDTRLIQGFPVKKICLQEIARHGATEIHNIAAFMGGVGAQVVLKVVLKQYVPLDNTLVFNGIHGACQTLRM